MHRLALLRAELTILTSAILSLAAVLIVATARAGAPEVSKNVRVYRAEEGVSVAVARVLPETEARAVIRVTGSDSPLDDLVLLAEVEPQGERGSTLKITWHGRSWGILTSRESWWGGNLLELHVPEQKSRSVYYDDKESKKLSSATLTSGLERDKGKVTALAAFDRPGEQKKHELTLKKAGDKVKASCGAALTIDVDWTSIDDDTLKSRHVGSFCSTPLESLASLCKDPARAAIAREKIHKATCRFGASLKLGVQTGSLTWQTSKDAANQAEFAKANLMNLLQ
jgi:hypothetical protein